MLQTKVLPKLAEPIRFSPTLHGSLANLIRSVLEQKFEGLIAKHRDSAYESGDRSGVAQLRVNQGQELVMMGIRQAPRTSTRWRSDTTKSDTTKLTG